MSAMFGELWFANQWLPDWYNTKSERINPKNWTQNHWKDKT